MQEKKQTVTSLRIDTDLWKEVKKAAIDNNLSLGEFIDRALRDKLQKLKEAPQK